MKKQLPLLFLVLIPLKAIASIVTINHDYKTIEAMSEVYSLERLEEALYLNAIDSIYRSYSSSEIASSGIYLSKYLDYKALSSIGSLEDEQKNYYYKRIYILVKEKIMPKIYMLGVLMLNSGKSAIFWGSYLSKICTQVECLCNEFEALVQNYTLSFKDIVFLKVIDEFKEAFSLNKANLLIQNMIEGFEGLSGDKDINFLSSLIDELYNLGIGIANLGSLSQFSSSNYNLLSNFINLNLTKMMNTQDEISSLFSSLTQEKQKDILSSIGINNAESLFTSSPYDTSLWKENYLLDEEKNSFYTQVWGIYPLSKEKEIAYIYEPNTEKENVTSSLEWVRLSSNSNLSQEEKEMILSNSEEYSMLSRSLVDELNLLDDGYSYSFSSQIVAIDISTDITAYAYKILIEKTSIDSFPVYEDIYDSYSMDLNAFISILEVKLLEFNSLDEGIIYTLKSGQKNYYELLDDGVLENIDNVIILLSCYDKQSLSSGSTQYKCKDETSSLSSKTKECAMLSLSEDEGLDLSMLYEKKEEEESKISSLKKQIEEVEQEIETLKNEINANASSINRTSFLASLNEKTDLLSSLEEDLEELYIEYNDLIKAINEALALEQETSNDCYRLPAIMEEAENTYNLIWTNEGYWDNYTFFREAKIEGILGTALFSATLKMIRKPKSFLGILIHRAIIKISWELTIDFENTSTLEVLSLSNSLTKEEKNDLISQKVLELKANYPECEIKVEYSSSKNIEKQTPSGNSHLMWMDERILAARDIEKELTKIYLELLLIEKYLYYKENVRDNYNSFLKRGFSDKERQKTLANKSFECWKMNLNKTLK